MTGTFFILLGVIYGKMGKAKLFGAGSVIVGVLLIVLAYLLVDTSFLRWVTVIFLPVMFVMAALAAIVIGVMLMIYG